LFAYLPMHGALAIISICISGLCCWLSRLWFVSLLTYKNIIDWHSTAQNLINFLKYSFRDYNSLDCRDGRMR
jgi:hypothetical protein